MSFGMFGDVGSFEFTMCTHSHWKEGELTHKTRWESTRPWWTARQIKWRVLFQRNNSIYRGWLTLSPRRTEKLRWSMMFDSVETTATMAWLCRLARLIYETHRHRPIRIQCLSPVLSLTLDHFVTSSRAYSRQATRSYPRLLRCSNSSRLRSRSACIRAILNEKWIENENAPMCVSDQWPDGWFIMWSFTLSNTRLIYFLPFITDEQKYLLFELRHIDFNVLVIV